MVLDQTLSQVQQAGLVIDREDSCKQRTVSIEMQWRKRNTKS